MQRLYSMFPKGAPGVALLLLRVSLGLGFAEERWQAPAEHPQLWLMLGAAVVAAALCLGVFTPLLCAVCAITDVATWGLEEPLWQRAHVCALLDAASLALLGPGAYSLDALAFGRRKIVFPPSDPPDSGASG